MASYFLAELMGLSFILIGLAGLIRPKLLLNAVRDFDHDSFSTFGLGVVTMIAGVALVMAHNVWDGTWRVVVTIFAWATLLKGFLYMTAPKSLLNMQRKLVKNETNVRVAMVVILIIGLYLRAKGVAY